MSDDYLADLFEDLDELERRIDRVTDLVERRRRETTGIDRELDRMSEFVEKTGASEETREKAERDREFVERYEDE